MSEALWAQRPRPTPSPDATAVGRWQPTTPADLTAHRRQLSAALQHATGAADADEVAVERLLLAFEELASNALRHSRGPIRVTVTADRDGWLLEVSDAAADRPPTPAVGRDAANGGLGLYLVARLSAAHGWDVHSQHKVVWCRIDVNDGRAAPEASIPHARGSSADYGHALI
jgi:anti-sigma regulatory factor (Ser/Thr protein kinase)